MALALINSLLLDRLELCDIEEWLQCIPTPEVQQRILDCDESLQNLTSADFASTFLDFLRSSTQKYFFVSDKKKFIIFESCRSEIWPKKRIQPTPDQTVKPRIGDVIDRAANVSKRIAEKLSKTNANFPPLLENSSGSFNRKNEGTLEPKNRPNYPKDGRNTRNKGRGRPSPSALNLGSFISVSGDKGNTSKVLQELDRVDGTYQVPGVDQGCSKEVTPIKTSVPWTKKQKFKSKDSIAKDRKKRLQKRLDHDKWDVQIASKSEQVDESFKALEIPDFSCVSEHINLEKLSILYALLFELDLIPDLGSEFCFIFSLLVMSHAKTSSENEIPTNSSRSDVGIPANSSVEENLLSTLLDNIHNCVYFATSILCKQKSFLKFLDRETLDLLLQNTKLCEFDDELYKFMTDIYMHRIEGEALNPKLPPFTGQLATVMFIGDNDAKPNFPTVASFDAFSKQRDAFYDILQEWEENHNAKDWSFVDALHVKIHDLLNLHPEPTNYIHLARLFRCQLVISCVGFAKVDEESQYDGTGASLEKFLSLQRRYGEYRQHVGPYRPQFPEYQEFFRSFIVTANDDKFLLHLRDNIAAEIVALNSLTFQGLGEDDTATFVDGRTQFKFLRCILPVRILAKFLAFMLFRPYRTNTSVIELIAAKQLEVRSKLPPLYLDVKRCLENAVEKGSLLVTVPWVVQYLALVDEISLGSNYFKDVVKLLFIIYSHLGDHVSVSSKYAIKLSIGWLLSCYNFKHSSYFKWYSELYDEEFMSDLNDSLLEQSLATVDSLDMVDSQMLYLLCPFLEDFKAVLASEGGPVNPGFFELSEVSKPSLFTDQEFQEGILMKMSIELDNEVDEDFLRMYPESVRTVIYFVAENVALSCIRRLICRTIVPEVVEEGVSRLREAEDWGDTVPFDIEDYCVSRTLEECRKRIQTYCDDRCVSTVPQLLSADMLPSVESHCERIAAVHALNKVVQWTMKNVTKEFFHSNMLLASKRKRPPSPRRPGEKTAGSVDPYRIVVHEESAPSPLDTIRQLKALVRKVCFNRGPNVRVEDHVDVTEIYQSLSMVYETVMHRADLIQCGETVLYRLILLLLEGLILFQPELVVEELLLAFYKLWCTNELRLYEGDAENFLSPQSLERARLVNVVTTQGYWTAMGNAMHFFFSYNIVYYKRLKKRAQKCFRTFCAEDKEMEPFFLNFFYYTIHGDYQEDKMDPVVEEDEKYVAEQYQKRKELLLKDESTIDYDTYASYSLEDLLMAEAANEMFNDEQTRVEMS